MSRPPHVIVCNGATISPAPSADREPLRLEYRTDEVDRNVRIGLPDFVQKVVHLPDRIRDLIEIAAYVYCADRQIKRGERDAVEYHSWGRNLNFAIKVRDYEFWNSPQTQRKLNELLSFLAGDASVHFTFQPGHATPMTSLLDQPGVVIPDGSEVILFSGGVDSLAGVVQQLDSSDDSFLLVSHQSGQPGVTRTQNQLFKAIDRDWPGRVRHIPFKCGLTGQRAREESQRTRFFLYATIAYAVAHVNGRNHLYAYENGITSLNLPKRQDLMNARASRTTHPRTIALLNDFFSEVHGGSFSIKTPFFWKTKTEVMKVLTDLGEVGLLSSSVSCSKTFKTEHSNQCGGCSQCVDRRFAAFSAGVEAYDESGLYEVDFVTENVADAKVEAAVTEFVGQAWRFAESSLDDFYTATAAELTTIVDSVDIPDEEECVTRLWNLTKRHGRQVLEALERMRETADDLRRAPSNSTLSTIIKDRQYLKPGAVPETAEEGPYTVFISYSHEDDTMVGDLLKHLSALQRKGLIEIWYDRRIGPGDEWKQEILDQIERADVILLMISASFIDSDFCYEEEMTTAIRRHDDGEALVVPVFVRECEWQNLPFAKLQGLPVDAKPVDSRKWRNRDAALAHIVQEFGQRLRQWPLPAS